MDFIGFPKIARLAREVIITEKIDGTNAQIFIGENGEFLTGSRTRWITPEDDNYGFAKWAQKNREELLQLGPGQHFGEWWGQGIQRGYNLKEKRFSLFNVGRWNSSHPDEAYPFQDGGVTIAPACCHVVPRIAGGPDFGSIPWNDVIDTLRIGGSFAARGVMKPEGIVIYHPASKQMFKKTIEKDEKPKGSKE